MGTKSPTSTGSHMCNGCQPRHLDGRPGRIPRGSVPQLPGAILAPIPDRTIGLSHHGVAGSVRKVEWETKTSDLSGRELLKERRGSAPPSHAPVDSHCVRVVSTGA